MPRTKNKPSRNCCCSDCAVRPGGDAKECCYCVCDELCVTMRTQEYIDSAVCNVNCGCDTSNCGCALGRGVLTWDEDNCYWSGNVTCGSLTIDMIVELKKVSGTCQLCVTSTCLGMNGTGNDCFDLSKCGNYLDGCLGHSAGEPDGFEFTFIRDIIAGCGDDDCSTTEFTVGCRNIVNPQPSSEDLCQDCDCVCECVCLTYCEDDGEECCEINRVCWNNEFRTTFNGTCDWSDQTAIITLVEKGGCCYWRLEVTRGDITSAVDQPAACPYPTITWTGIDGTNTWSLVMECTNCDEECSVENGCCEDDFPYTLYARICDQTGCNCNSCVPLTLRQLSPLPTWRGTATICCSDIPGCEEFDVTIEVTCGSGNLFTISLYCDGDTSPNTGGTADSATCVPICLEKLMGVVVTDCDNFPCDTASGAAEIQVCVSEAPC